MSQPSPTPPARPRAIGSKKAGGVFYTPSFLADFMVRRALEGLGEGARLPAILDPACGEGVFLVSAYRELLRRRADLTPARLCESLHGLDLDPRSVAATRRALAAEAGIEGVEALERNVRCGNALVDRSHDAFATGRQVACDHLRPFDWHDVEHGFGEVMARGGFDLVIGNPPYRRERDYKALLDEVAASDFGRRFRRPRMDLWYLFLHRSLELLKPGGRLCFVVNSYWTSGAGAEALIETLRSECRLDEVVLLGAQRVFEGVQGRHLILLLSKARAGGELLVRRVPKSASVRACVEERARFVEYRKPIAQVFRDGMVDLERPDGGLLARLERFPPL